jgi:hypothetical protein
VTLFGPIHKLIVHEVGDDDEPFHVNDFEDCEIEHPAECKREQARDSQGRFTYSYYCCGVQHNVENIGVRWSLRYSGTPVTKPGEYQIQAWAETYRGFEYTEYDGGLALVSDDLSTEISA